MKLLLRSLLIAALAGLLVWGCSEDDDNTTTGTLRGQVVFHGNWPDSGTVQLSIFTNWNNEGTGCYWCATSAGGPPAYYTHASFFQDPDTSNLTDPDTLEFEITGITLGTYETVVTGWRRPVQGGNIECDEPVIGMYGANPGTADSIPDAITFSDANPEQTITLHSWFDRRLPVPGCDNLGRIEGTVNLQGDWPAPAGVAVIITSQPYTAWQPGGIAGYRGRYALRTAADTYFTFTQPYGSYYVSLWTNEQPPNNKYLGAYGVNIAAGDARPNMLTISAQAPLAVSGAVAGTNPPPHWISGTVTFEGTRPAEGVMVLLNTTFPPQGPPSGIFRITDAAETLYAVTGMVNGSYYVSLWKNSSTEYVLYGAYFDPDGGDTNPDPVVISDQVWGLNGINITGRP